MKTNSEITVFEAIKNLEYFSPVKVVFNGIVLYDDWNFDEVNPPLEVLRERLWHYENYVITYIEVKIVSFHHSFVYLHGELREENND
jgi:hypothetical protein